MKSHMPVFLGFMLSLLVRIATSQDGSGEYYGSGGCKGDEALTLSGECAVRCSEGYTWCPDGSYCSPIGTVSGYYCPCMDGFYEDAEMGVCVLGRFFGGEISFNSVSRNAYALRELSGECNPSGSTVDEVITQIYGSDPLYVSHEILSETNSTCSATYQLVFENAVIVDDEYVKTVFENVTQCNGTAESVESSDFDYLDCTESYGSVVVPSILCDEGEYANYCVFPAICNVTNIGSPYCECDSPNVLPYEGATTCQVAKCVSNEDCNFGTCSQESSILEQQCICTWGFTGDYCTDPWWLVFTVLTAALGIILIIVIISCCACTSKSTKTTKENVEADELDFKNPFVDFQPGVRAKVSSNIYNSVSDPLSTQSSQGHSNPAFNNNAYDDTPNKTSGNSAAQGNEYF